MMKTFASNLMVISMSYAFLFAGSNATITDENILISKTNLRGAVGIHLDSFTRHRRVEEENVKETEKETKATSSPTSKGTEPVEKEAQNETEELENIETEFGNEDEVSEKETEELENIEKEFEGDNNDQKKSTQEDQSTLDAKETGKKEVEEVESLFTNVPTGAIVAAPTDKPTSKYNGGNDEYDPIKDEDEKEELESELKQEEKVARRAGGLGIFFGIIAMIFTAHQMSENPDGIYASVCRLAITISSVVIKIVCMPCRKLIGGGNGNPYSGHMPISTSDYSYRNDPYRSNANAGFEMK